MSAQEREYNALRYIDKCNRRRARIARQRHRKMMRTMNMLPAFSVGCFVMACVLWAVLA